MRLRVSDHPPKPAKACIQGGPPVAATIGLMIPGPATGICRRRWRLRRTLKTCRSWESWAGF
jgi:hypothetical protein